MRLLTLGVKRPSYATANMSLRNTIHMHHLYSTSRGSVVSILCSHRPPVRADHFRSRCVVGHRMEDWWIGGSHRLSAFF